LPFCPFALLPFCPFAPYHNPNPNPNPKPADARKDSTRSYFTVPARDAACKVRSSSALLSLCPCAPLPYSPIALMPFCPFALLAFLSFCPLALLPFSPLALLPFCPFALYHNPNPNPNPKPLGARKDSTRFYFSVPARHAAYKVRFSFALLSFCHYALSLKVCFSLLCFARLNPNPNPRPNPNSKPTLVLSAAFT
jgi:hypothetical protein